MVPAEAMCCSQGMENAAVTESSGSGTGTNLFAIRPLVIGGGEGISISGDTFRDIGEAQRGLISFLRLEDIYDVFVSNYMDLERTAHRHLLDQIVYWIVDRIEWERARRDIDRVVSNLLSSGRLYRDSIQRVILQIFGRRSNELSKIITSLERHKTCNIGYRAMEELRNFVQHNALPTNSLSFNHSWTGMEETSALRSSILFGLDPKMLLADRKVDKLLVSALAAQADKHGQVAMLPLVRSYVSALSDVHADVRDAIASREAGWIGILEAARQLYSAAGGDPDTRGLAAVFRTKEGAVKEIYHLNIDLVERLRYLQRRNRKLSNLHRRQIVL